MSKVVAPSLGASSFSCPHCGAFSDQAWFDCWIKQRDGDKEILVWTHSNVNHEFIKIMQPDKARDRMLNFVKRLKNHPLTFRQDESPYVQFILENAHFSHCRSCGGIAVWILDSIVYPATDGAHVPHDDMPPDVKTVFVEAASISSQSPRGAAALLRLAIELLMPHLSAEGSSLNDRIGSLVKRGLDPVVQKALDVVRVTGNNAVHPGQIEMQDDAATANKLFGLVNIVVATMISARKQIDEMFEGLPEGVKNAIAKRDQPKQIEPPK